MDSMKFIERLKMSREKLLKLASQYAHLDGTTLLYTGEGHEGSSYLYLFPTKTFVISPPFKKNPWEILKEKMVFSQVDERAPSYVGYLTYELGAYTEEHLTLPNNNPGVPYALFFQHSWMLKVDHTNDEALIFATEEGTQKFHDEKMEVVTSQESSWRLSERSDTKKSYMDKVEQVKRAIVDGDVYQVNVSQKFTFEGDENPFSLFLRLSKSNPAPFSSYIKLDDFAIMSASPERFIKKEGQSIQTCPIKGTAPRNGDDIKTKQKLFDSLKDRSELMMITDLMRNDLARVSETGSVLVKELVSCQRFQDVYHLVSNIISKAKKGLHPIDLIRRCFPGGSITGCPKIRSMEYIAKLENRPRGIYTGSIGHIHPNGDLDFNIAIRTLSAHKGKVDLQLGGAVVYDSDAEAEFEETLHKGRSFFSVLNLTKQILASN